MKARLTAERLFSDPPLAGHVPRAVRVSPDGRFASWLAIAGDDRERLDLWGADLATGRPERWLNAMQVPSAPTASAAERNERERRRLFGHGITGHAWSGNSRELLIEASGAGYLFDAASRSIRRITPAGHRYTDIRLSPERCFVSYVRERNLFHLHLESGIERAVARSDDPAVSYGVADFLAQEEMHRFDGHWWSPNEDAIVFTRVDVSPVAEISRYGAGGLEAVRQRYPFAGTGNPAVEFGRYELGSGAIAWLRYRDDPEDYLARVGFANLDLVLAVQNRAQNRLRIKVIPSGEWDARLLHEESCDTWINLNDNFTALGEADYLWTSERDGFSHLFRHRDGRLEQLTAGAGHIEKILHANAERALVSGWFETPTERQLYHVALENGDVSQLTGPGWHEFSISRDGRSLIDCCSDLTGPGEIRWGRDDGSFRTLARTPVDDSHPYSDYFDNHATSTLGSLAAEDGQMLHYRLTQPPGDAGDAPESGFPLIVWVYGGPGAQIVRNAWPPLTLQLFCQNGVRGSRTRQQGYREPGTRVREAPVPAPRRRGGPGPGGRRAPCGRPGLGRREPDRRIRAQLRRLHDAHVPVPGTRTLPRRG